MHAELVSFGRLEIDGQPFDYDVVIEAGRIRKRKKKPSKTYKAQYGHTPLSADESIPWGGTRLIVGTGMHGSLPIMPELRQEAERRGVLLVDTPTPEACKLISGLEDKDINAILHVTC